MKKTVITILMAFFVISGYSQSAYSAMMLSENDYEGTARTAAMGNAFTALGGDLGAVSINPAATAVAKYSQVTLSPGISIISSTAAGVSPYENGDLPYFEKTMKSTRALFNLPNIGVAMTFNTGRKTGVKSFSAAFVMNKTASYGQNVYAAGTNSTTSFIGQMAYEASVNGYPSSSLASDNAFDIMPWKPVIGYKTGMIEPYEDIYVAATEKVYNDKTAFMGGTVQQNYGRNISGNKYDYLLNFGLNISDFVYIGLNLGLTSANYSYSEYFTEKAIDPSEFEIGYVDNDGNPIPSLTKYFDKMKYSSSYHYSGMGYFAKLGVIVTPIEGVRIGAAIQTPTAMSVNESWEESGETEFTGANGGKYSSESPYGENKWSFSSPFHANVGVAYTFNKVGLISLDYELSDYGSIKYRNSAYTDRDILEDINDEIRNSYGVAHKVRVGGEFKPIPALALRAGYNLNVSGEKAVWDGWEYAKVKPTLSHKAALGIGFSSNKSFFADLALTRSFLPKEYFMPYSDYVFKYTKDEELIVDPNYYAPEILIKPSLWNVILTIGFRF